MDAVEFCKELSRLCSNHECSNCPIGTSRNFNCTIQSRGDNAESVVEIVEQWAKVNPVKTRQSEFLKLFPKAEIKDDTLWMCPKYISCDYRPEENCHEISCSDCKRKFWLTEVTDNGND